MAHLVRWTRLALSDLCAVRERIALDDPDASEAFVRKIRGSVERLAAFPGSGRLVPERRAQGYREVVVAPYRVVYSVVGGEVWILRVWHGRRSMSK